MQERPALWGLHPGTGAVTQLLAMEHLIPPGHKKVPKVYTAACHPTLPHLLAVAANSGDAPPPLLPSANPTAGICASIIFIFLYFLLFPYLLSAVMTSW